ncbi:MAG: MarR family [Myxococcaceae bacterium]|jgi:DNA-binding MarR family transcriptional regulator|nr:MarR family [Myxococcaceae bacterium]
MNRLTFSLKRVFHRSIQLGRKMTRPYGLTPSRFDLMRAIECQRQKWIQHKDVHELLGVCGPTVTRMAGSLVEKGFLERRDDPEDARRTQYRLTRLGRTALGCAVTHIVKSGYILKVSRRAVSDYEDFFPATEKEARRRLDEMMALLETLQRNLGDASRFVHSDDGRRPPAIEQPIFQADHDEKGNWPGDDPPLYVWIAENLPLPAIAA